MLLILAVVTIKAVNEGSLFVHANNAATAYSKSQEDENIMISNYIAELEKHDKGQNGGENPEDPQTPTESDSIVGTYTNIPDPSYVLNLNDDNTWTFSTASGNYEYEDNVLSIIYNNSVIGQCNVIKINGTTAIYSEAMTFGGLLFAKDTTKLERRAFDTEKSEITCTNTGWKYVFRTDGTYGKYQGTNPTTDNDGNYGIYTGLEGYILMGNASTDWYKFTSDTTIEILN